MKLVTRNGRCPEIETTSLLPYSVDYVVTEARINRADIYNNVKGVECQRIIRNCLFVD